MEFQAHTIVTKQKVQHNSTVVAKRWRELLHIQDDGSKVTLVGAVLDLLLGVMKLSAGFGGQSAALVADGLHSISDAVSDVVVAISYNLSRWPATDRYPYGFRKAEALGTLFLGTLLLLFAAGLFIDSLIALVSPTKLVMPSVLTLYITGICIVLKEAYYWVSLHVGRRLESNLLIANAQHSRTDVYSSILVLVGLIGTRYGYLWLDQLLALVVASIVLKMSVTFISQSAQELIDANMPAAERKKLETLILEIEGVGQCQKLHARGAGGNYLVEVEITVDGTLSVSTAQQIRSKVEEALKCENDKICHSCVKIVPQHESP